MDKQTAKGRASVVDEARRSIAKEGAVDVVELADRLGLEVYQESLPDSSSGYIEYKDGDTYIVINENHPLTRQRFTIAHELGHYVHDFDKLKELGRLDRSKEKISNEVEIVADTFAANILMPENETKILVKKLNDSKISAEVIEKIAEHFRVSRSMAIVRIRELGISVPYIEFA